MWMLALTRTPSRTSASSIQWRVRKSLGHPRAPTAYRTDVRAHERCRIMRGKLPLNPDLRDKLIKRGYKIFTTLSWPTCPNPPSVRA